MNISGLALWAWVLVLVCLPLTTPADPARRRWYRFTNIGSHRRGRLDLQKSVQKSVGAGETAGETPDDDIPEETGDNNNLSRQTTLTGSVNTSQNKYWARTLNAIARIQPQPSSSSHTNHNHKDKNKIPRMLSPGTLDWEVRVEEWRRTIEEYYDHNSELASKKANKFVARDEQKEAV